MLRLGPGFKEGSGFWNLSLLNKLLSRMLGRERAHLHHVIGKRGVAGGHAGYRVAS